MQKVELNLQVVKQVVTLTTKDLPEHLVKAVIQIQTQLIHTLVPEVLDTMVVAVEDIVHHQVIITMVYQVAEEEVDLLPQP